MRRFLTASVVLAWSAFLVPDVGAAGRLCFGTACREAACGDDVEPADVARPFVVTNAAGDVHDLGVLKAGARAVTCAGTRVELRVISPGVRGGNARLVLAEDGELRWEVPVAERQFGEPVVLAIPKGAYSVEVTAAHAIRHRSTLTVGDEPLRLTVQLQPLPILSGVVKDKRTGGPLAGAVIVAGDGAEAVTDAAGMFRIELDPERWPERVTVEALGFATKTVNVPGAR
ncbi:MAG: CarboxypepD reg-like domain, partial [Acidobacteriota bacterium]|nr:CarboxypepD reg-like domain [Acidobacteriota bacterium]